MFATRLALRSRGFSGMEVVTTDTRRVSSLLHSPRWSASLLADWLWQQADARIHALRASGEEPLLVWDGSVLEKPETIKNDDLCALRSSTRYRRPTIASSPTALPYRFCK